MNGWMMSHPAAFTSTSRRPISVSILVASVSADARSVTSSGMNRTSPMLFRSAAAASPAAMLRSVNTTRAPASAKARAVASPIPDAAPVTTTTLSVNFILLSILIENRASVQFRREKRIDARARFFRLHELPWLFEFACIAVRGGIKPGGDTVLRRDQSGPRQAGDASDDLGDMGAEPVWLHGPLHNP